MPNYRDVVDIVEALIARRDPYNHHGPRVSLMAIDLAQHLALSAREIEMISIGGALHDIGKLLVWDDILNQPRKLTLSEMAMIKVHAREGWRLLAPLKYDPIILDIVLHHHEDWDGNGYPDGIGGEQISAYARIIRIVDVFDALTSRRPYRRALETDFAVRQMRELSGKFFDPKFLDIFLRKVIKVDG